MGDLRGLEVAHLAQAGDAVFETAWRAVGEPQTGQEPVGPGIRVDSGVYAGWQIPVAYDPLLAKVVAWDRTRPEVIARVREALRRYVLLGCRTNLTFLQDIVAHEAFRSGNTTTRVIEQHFRGWRPAVPDEIVAVAAAVAALSEQDPTILVPGAGGGAGRIAARGEPQAFQDPWEGVGRWRMGAGRG